MALISVGQTVALFEFMLDFALLIPLANYFSTTETIRQKWMFEKFGILKNVLPTVSLAIVTRDLTSERNLVL